MFSFYIPQIQWCSFTTKKTYYFIHNNSTLVVFLVIICSQTVYYLLNVHWSEARENTIISRYYWLMLCSMVKHRGRLLCPWSVPNIAALLWKKCMWCVQLEKVTEGTEREDMFCGCFVWACVSVFLFHIVNDNNTHCQHFHLTPATSMPLDPWDTFDAANEDLNLSGSALCFYFERPERAFSR